MSSAVSVLKDSKALRMQCVQCARLRLVQCGLRPTQGVHLRGQVGDVQIGEKLLVRALPVSLVVFIGRSVLKWL